MRCKLARLPSRLSYRRASDVVVPRRGDLRLSDSVGLHFPRASFGPPLASRSPPLQHHEPTSYLPYMSNTMASNEIPIPRDPTEEEALALFKAVEEKFPSKSLGDDKWYILTV
jgi:hypothetical protein